MKITDCILHYKRASSSSSPRRQVWAKLKISYRFLGNFSNKNLHRVKDNPNVQFYHIFHRESLYSCLCVFNSVSITNVTLAKVNFEGIKVDINLEPHLLDDPLKTSTILYIIPANSTASLKIKIGQMTKYEQSLNNPLYLCRPL